MSSSTLPSVEQLNGLELRALKAELGRPFLEAIEDDFDAAAYAYVWIAERRATPTLTIEDVLERPFGEILELFKEANEARDPMSAANGAA